MNHDGLIHAFALALAQSLAKHGIAPQEGRSTVHAVCTELCQQWGGESHWLPRTYRAGRDTVIVEAVKQGASCREAAQKAGVHADTVRRVLQRQSAGLGRDEWVL